MVAIIILCYGGAAYTKKCVESVLKYTKYPYKILLIDNASQDDGLTKKYIEQVSAEHKDKIIPFYNNENLGYAGGNNVGMKYAYKQGFEHICILNNDTIVINGWLELMLEKLNMKEEDCYIKNIGIVGPVSNYAGGSQGIPCELNNLDTSKITDEIVQDYGAKWNAKYRGQFLEVTKIVGLCFLMTRAVIEKIGYLDERYKKGMWEDIDYCMRAKLSGIKMVISYDTFLWHYGSRTIEAGGKDFGKELFNTNGAIFNEKWNKLLNNGSHKKIVGAARIKNMAKYIERTLTMASKICDEIVIHDGMSTDGTYEICKKFPKVVDIVRAPHPIDSGGPEAEDRNEVIEMAKKRNPDFIYCIDGDEIFEDKAAFVIQRILNKPNFFEDLLVFPVFTFWNDEENYRADGIWGGMLQGRIFRNLPNQKIYFRKEMGVMHSGAHPYIPMDSHTQVFLRLKHYGYVDRDNRARKYEWYTKSDTGKNAGMILGGYESYYKKIYYGDEKHVVEDKDYYRHLVDERGMVLKRWIENNTLSLVMIAKNEEKYIGKCIQSVLPMVDEIVLVDTGSTDKTVEIAEQLGAKVYHYEWNGEFSGPRNMSLRAARGYWILRLDPDELINKNDLTLLWRMIQDDNMDIYIFPIINYLEEPKPGCKWALSETCRLFKNDIRFYYQGVVHEELDTSILGCKARGEKISIGRSPFSLHHLGYLKDRTFVKEKLKRYEDMNKEQIKKTPDNPGPYHALGLHYYEAGKYKEAIKLFKTAIEKKNNFWSAWNDLGTIYLNKRLLGKASRMFKKAKEVQEKGINEILVMRVEDNIKNVNKFIEETYSRIQCIRLGKIYLWFIEKVLDIKDIDIIFTPFRILDIIHDKFKIKSKLYIKFLNLLGWPNYGNTIKAEKDEKDERNK